MYVVKDCVDFVECAVLGDMTERGDGLFVVDELMSKFFGKDIVF